VVRNAVDHGIESAGERQASGKPHRARLILSAEERPGAVILSIADDGRGIDWGALARSAAARGLPAVNPDDLVEAMFADGISTRQEVSDTSGRGVGLAAVRQVVTELGGHLRVFSEPGQGTRFELAFPVSSPPRLRAAS
jgi:two-component system chemotaxis sensor kinase CheA